MKYIIFTSPRVVRALLYTEITGMFRKPIFKLFHILSVFIMKYYIVHVTVYFHCVSEITEPASIGRSLRVLKGICSVISPCDV